LISLLNGRPVMPEVAGFYPRLFRHDFKWLRSGIIDIRVFTGRRPSDPCRSS
jgi:hypothetical protein